MLDNPLLNNQLLDSSVNAEEELQFDLPEELEGKVSAEDYNAFMLDLVEINNSFANNEELNIARETIQEAGGLGAIGGSGDMAPGPIFWDQLLPEVQEAVLQNGGSSETFNDPAAEATRVIGGASNDYTQAVYQLMNQYEIPPFIEKDGRVFFFNTGTPEGLNNVAFFRQADANGDEVGAYDVGHINNDKVNDFDLLQTLASAALAWMVTPAVFGKAPGAGEIATGSSGSTMVAGVQIPGTIGSTLGAEAGSTLSQLISSALVAGSSGFNEQDVDLAVEEALGFTGSPAPPATPTPGTPPAWATAVSSLLGNTTDPTQIFVDTFGPGVGVNMADDFFSAINSGNWQDVAEAMNVLVPSLPVGVPLPPSMWTIGSIADIMSQPGQVFTDLQDKITGFFNQVGDAVSDPAGVIAGVGDLIDNYVTENPSILEDLPTLVGGAIGAGVFGQDIIDAITPNEDEGAGLPLTDGTEEEETTQDPLETVEDTTQDPLETVEDTTQDLLETVEETPLVGAEGSNTSPWSPLQPGGDPLQGVEQPPMPDALQDTLEEEGGGGGAGTESDNPQWSPLFDYTQVVTPARSRYDRPAVRQTPSVIGMFRDYL